MASAEYRNAHYPTQAAQDVMRSMFREWVHTEYERAEQASLLQDASAPCFFDRSLLQDVLHALHGDYERMPDDIVEELFYLYDMAGEGGNPEVTAEEFPEWRSRNLSYSYHNGARTVCTFLHHMETVRKACKRSAADQPQLQQLFPPPLDK
jgi:hypothetical protein